MYKINLISSSKLSFNVCGCGTNFLEKNMVGLKILGMDFHFVCAYIHTSQHWIQHLPTNHLNYRLRQEIYISNFGYPE